MVLLSWRYLIRIFLALEAGDFLEKTFVAFDFKPRAEFHQHHWSCFVPFCRGEKAFCSTDCRDKHIRSDDHNEKCGSEARKPFDYSESPCSGPLMFFAGVAAA